MSKTQGWQGIEIQSEGTKKVCKIVGAIDWETQLGGAKKEEESGELMELFVQQAFIGN